MTAYSFRATHNATGIAATVTVMFDLTPTSTEAQRDAIFQAFLSKIAEISGSTMNSATKNGGYSQPVTP